MSAYERVGAGVPGYRGERQVRHLGGGDADNRALDREEVAHLGVEGRSSLEGCSCAVCCILRVVTSLREGQRPKPKYPAMESRAAPTQKYAPVTRSQRKKNIDRPCRALVSRVHLILIPHPIPL
jgi:hypothetical protein